MASILKYFVIFFFYSAAGWLVESLYCSVGEKRFINRGFLTGPMCPIYGTGALVMTICLYNPFSHNPLIVFALGMLLCDVVEYITSLLMEILFHARWWDYTYEFLNIRGRICLKHTLYWGVASVSFVYILHPTIDKIIDSFSLQILSAVAGSILVVFVIDVIHAVKKALDIRQLQLKLAAAVETISGVLNNMKNTIGDKYDSLQENLDKGNQKINDATSEIIVQAQEIIEQFELRFSVKTKTDKGKYSSRFFRNGFNIEKTTKTTLEWLKNITDDIKANLFEDGEKQ